jgi:hypothetical protein
MITDVITLLQSLHSDIVGIETAPVAYPGSISNAQLPCVLVIPGRAITRQLTSGSGKTYQRGVLRSERNYSIRCYVGAIGQNEYDTPSQTAIGLLEKFILLYYSRFPLTPLVELVSIEDSGIISGGEYVLNQGLTYAGQPYRGFIITAVILELL